MLPILGCENTKKQFLDHFIFAKNENESYQRDIDRLEKTLRIATTGSEMEKTFICANEEREDPRTVILNISGKEFRTKLSNFRKFPQSRLGQISSACSLREIQDLCEGFVPGPVPVFFFHRNPQQFNLVLDLYRKDEIHICERHCTLGGLCSASLKLKLKFNLFSVVKTEFLYWGLDELLLEVKLIFPQI